MLCHDHVKEFLGDGSVNPSENAQVLLDPIAIVVERIAAVDMMFKGDLPTTIIMRLRHLV